MLMGMFIFDPTAFSSHFGVKYDEDNPMPDMAAITEAAVDPTGEKMALLMGIDENSTDPPSPDVKAAFAAVMPGFAAGLGAIPEPPVPPIPSPELFELGLDLDLGNTGLVTFQLNVFKAPVDAVVGLLSKIPELMPPTPDALIGELCGVITEALGGGDEDKAIENAAYRVMAERMITAASTALTSMAMGPGGVVADSIFKGTGGFTEETVAQRDEKLQAEDVDKNDIPLPLNGDNYSGRQGREMIAVLIPPAVNAGVIKSGQFTKDQLSKVGGGIKAKTFQQIRDIGKNIFAPGAKDLLGNTLTDEEKGLLVLMVLWHETGMDGGTSRASDDQKGVWKYSDFFVWGFNTFANIGVAHKLTSTISAFEDGGWKGGGAKAVNSVPLLTGDIGMPLDLQLNYYAQYMTRQLSIVMTNNRNDGFPPEYRRSNYAGAEYTHIPLDHLQQLKDAYSGGAPWEPGLKLEGKYIWINQSYGSGVSTFQAEPKIGDPNGQPYLMQTIYDLYAFHDVSTNGGSNYFGFGAKYKVPYTLALRTATLISPAAMGGRITAAKVDELGQEGAADEGLILKEYMAAVGWNPGTINWNKYLVGLQPYLSADGKKVRLKKYKSTHTRALFPAGGQGTNETWAAKWKLGADYTGVQVFKEIISQLAQFYAELSKNVMMTQGQIQKPRPHLVRN